MPEGTAITLYVTPYVRKFVITNLADPQRGLVNSGARWLWADLQRHLGYDLLGVLNDYDPHVDAPRGRVTVFVRTPDGPVQLHDKKLSRIAWKLTHAYLSDMYSWVDYYRLRFGMKVRPAMEQFRKQYSITEEDHAFASAERMYQYHCQRNGKSRPYSMKNRPLGKRRAIVRIVRGVEG